MMQPSELDRTILTPKEGNARKPNRVYSSPSTPSHLSVVPNPTPDRTEKSEIPSFGISENGVVNKSETPKTPSDNTSQTEDSQKSNQPVLADNTIPPSTDQPETNDNEPSDDRGFLPVLKNGNFLALWGGQVFCQLADKVYLVLMIALINSQFQSSEQTISGWVSALMMAFTIPAILFGSLAGVFVDRWSKKAVLVTTNVWRGILVLIVPLLLWLTRGWKPIGVIPVGFIIILAITFLVSTLTQFFAPAEQAAIPLIVEEKHLLSANSLYTTTMMASVIVGFAVGEPILTIADNIWQHLFTNSELGKEIIVGGSYAIAGLILLRLTTHEKSQPLETEPPHVFEDLRDGLRYLRGNTRLRNALIQLIILFSVFAALTVLAVRMAEVIPNLKASQFGFLLAAGGVGIAIGATIIGQFGQRFSYNQLFLCGFIGMGASLFGLSLFTKQLWIALSLVTLIGIFGALIGIPMQTAIQTETPAEMRGKVFGLQNNVINIALSLPLALAGVAETFVGLPTVFLGLAVIVFSGGLLSWFNTPE